MELKPTDFRTLCEIFGLYIDINLRNSSFHLDGRHFG